MNKQLEQVTEFNRLAGQNITSSPRKITKEDFYLQFGLIEEEVRELKDAFDADNYVEVLDALVDIQYVLLGMVSRLGFQHEFINGFEEVHENNMTKIFDKNGNNVTVFKPFTDSFGIERLKVGKPEGFQPVNLKNKFPYLNYLSHEG